jgi:hypothetical protein
MAHSHNRADGTVIPMSVDDDPAWDLDVWNAYETATADLHNALNTVLSRIAEHPEDLSGRRLRMYRPPVFVVEVPGDDGWVVMWRPGEEGPEIHYVGPDPF